MNDTPAAFKACVHGMRTVPTRKVVQITIEAPIEHHATIAAIAEHGTWVGVARIQDPEAGSSSGKAPDFDSGNADSIPAPAAKPVRQRTPWDELTATKQAVLRCKEPGFQQWVIEQEGFDEEEDKELNAARYVRKECNVNTRGDLKDNQRARAMWNAIEDRYLDSVMAARAFG